MLYRTHASLKSTRLTGDIVKVQFGLDGTLVTASLADGGSASWDVRTGKEIDSKLPPAPAAR